MHNEQTVTVMGNSKAASEIAKAIEAGDSIALNLWDKDATVVVGNLLDGNYLTDASDRIKISLRPNPATLTSKEATALAYALLKAVRVSESAKSGDSDDRWAIKQESLESVTSTHCLLDLIGRVEDVEHNSKVSKKLRLEQLREETAQRLFKQAFTQIDYEPAMAVEEIVVLQMKLEDL